jgi:ABC-type lipopolysaccharide export system ATPase subunit
MSIACTSAAASDGTAPKGVLVLDAITYNSSASGVLGPVSLSVCAGEIVGLLGVNGAGKTSLLRTIAGDRKALGGKIHVHQIEITRLTRSRRQAAGLFVCLPDHRRFRANRSLLEIISAAINSEPKVLVLDEPFNGLPPGNLSIEVMLAIFRECRAAGCGILIADHDIRAALQIVDRAYLIRYGKIIIHGSSDELKGRLGD